MKKQLYVSRLRQAIQHRNGYLILASASILLNMLLVAYQFRMMSYERIVLVPPEISKSFWVDGHHVSPEYLSEMAHFFVNLRLTASPGNIGAQHRTLLRYVDSASYSDIRSQLQLEAERIKSFGITTSFYTNNVTVANDQWLTRVSGDLHTTIGNELQPVQHITYQIAFSYDAGRLLVKSFEEIKHD